MSQSPLPPNSPSNYLIRLLRITRKSSNVGIGLISATIILISYTGLRLFLQEYLPPWLEKQVSYLINRPVNIDELQGFSFTRLYLGAASVPKTPDHPNQLTASRVVVHFDPIAVLFKRTLVIKIIPEDVEIELRQYPEGDLLKGEITDEIIPIKLDLTFDVKNVSIDVFPQGTNNLLETTLNGQARYSEVTQEKWNYNLSLALLNSEISLEGETVLGTKESHLKLAITKLNFSQLMPLLIDSPVQLNRGDIKADLNLTVPSIRNLSETKAEGTINLSNIQGRVNFLEKPVQVAANISFQDNKILVKKAQANLGNITASLFGQYDWTTGSNLEVNISGLSSTNIQQVYPTKFPIEVEGELGVKFNLTGMFNAPLLKGKIENRKVIEIAQTKLEKITIDFQSNLDSFLLKKLSIIPKVGGEITAQGTAEPKILRSIINGDSIDWKNIPFKLIFKTELPSKQIIEEYYSLPAVVNSSVLKVQGNIKGSFANPKGLIKWNTVGSLDKVDTQIISKGNILIDKNNISFKEIEFVTEKGKVTINGSGDFKSKRWQAYLSSSSLDLTPFAFIICNVKRIECPRNIYLESANVNIEGKIDRFWKKSINLYSNIALAVDNGNLVIDSRLQQGKFKTSVTGLQFTLNSLLTNISIPITFRKYQFNLSGNIEEILQKLTLNINAIKGNSNLEIEIANSSLNAQIFWKNGLFKGTAELKSLSLNQFVPKLPVYVQLTNSKINFLGNLQSLLSPDSVIPLQVTKILIEIGQQNIKANGSLTLTNLFNNPDIASINLNVDTQADLSILPITEFFTKIPIDRQLFPQAIDLAGKGKFKGRLVGKNILTSPLFKGNFQLKGNLTLSNFSFNELNFESVLKGEINLVAGQEFFLDLQGKKDVISAVFTSCLPQECLLPYILESFEISQKYRNIFPILVKGNRKGARLVAKIQNFPLKRLKLSLIDNYNLTNYLGEKVNLNLEIDTLTLTGRGRLDILNPNLGKVFGDNLQINWVYQNGNITINNTLLKVGKSSCNFMGKIALETGKIQGKLQVSKNYIQKFLTFFKIYNINSLVRFLELKTDSFSLSKQVTSKPVGDVNAPLSEQVNQLWKNDQEIIKNTIERKASQLPQELDIKGELNGEIYLSGTLKSPEITFKFEGENWEWTSQAPTPSIINPLGFVLESSPVIYLDKLVIKGKIKDGIVNIYPLIKLSDSSIEANLNLTYYNNQFDLQPSTFSINNLTLDTVRSLIVIPGDINGSITLKGSLTGSLIKPEIDGVFFLKKGVINARLLGQDFQGNFAYSNAQLELQINKPDFIQAYASLPLPIKTDNDNRFKINAQLETEAFSLLEILTQEQISLVNGEGKINLDLSGKITLNKELKVDLDLNSKSSLYFIGITLKSHLLPNLLTLNGKVTLQDRKIKVDKLTGKIGEATIKAAGVLPLFYSSLQDIKNAISLNVTITKDKVSSYSLYQGIANALIIIKGSVINPIIEGKIELSKGKFVVPNSIPKKPKNKILEQWMRMIIYPKKVVILPKFNNFRILIEEVSIEQKNISPKFIFNVSGNLGLSGQLAKFSLPGLLTLKPSGKVYINSGQVDIPVTRIFIPRQSNNVITFLPQEGLLNPYIDLEFKLYILNLALRTMNVNEIADDIVQSGRSQSVEITLGIKGDANQLLPDIGTKLEKVCKLRSYDYLPIPKTSAIDYNKLRQLVKCIRVNNLGTNSIQDLLQSPIVSFSSSPRLSSGELLTLFGTQFSNLVEQLQQQNSAQLVEAGLPQVAVVLFPFLQDWLFELNEATNQVGQEWGLGHLRLYPVLETVYELEDSSLIRFSYDYSFNEVIIRYENKF